MGFTFENKLDDVLKKLDNGIAKGLKNAGIDITAAIQERGDHPVVTGNLRQNWDYEPKTPKNKVTVGNRMEYSPYVEFGTTKQAAQHPGRKGFLDV